MRVTVGSLDSGRIKEANFSKYVNTSDPDSAKPEFKTLDANDAKNGVIQIEDSPQGFVLLRSKGNVEVLKGDLESARSIGVVEAPVSLQVLDDKIVVAGSQGSGSVFTFSGDKICDFELREEINTFVSHPNETGLFLSTGLTQLPELCRIDLGSGKVEKVWDARGAKNTILDLKEANDVSSAAFLPAEKGYKFITATIKGRLRVYYTEHGRRPLINAQTQSKELKAVAVLSNSDVIVAGRSHVARYEITPKVRLVGTYKGAMGTTLGLSIHGEHFACVGYDRYIRVYNIETRASAGKVFTNEEMKAVLFLQDDEEKRLLDEDELWNDVDRASKKQKSVA